MAGRTGGVAREAPNGHHSAMATQADVRRIALSFSGAEEVKGRFAFEIPNKRKLKGFVWVWMERVTPKKPRVANPGVIAVRVANLVDKDLLISSEPTKFFTEPHYDGFPAILVRLAEVKVAELRPLIADAWRCQAPGEPGTAKKAKRATTKRPELPRR